MSRRAANARSGLILVLGLTLSAWLAPAPAARAQDIREAARRAAADRTAARQEARTAQQRILADRDSLQAAVQRFEARRTELETELADIEQSLRTGDTELERSTAAWSDRELGFREISGNVRVAARDLESLLKASPLSAGADWRLDTVQPLLDTGYFPDIDDIMGMTAVFLDEAERGGQVSRQQGEFVGRDGRTTTGDIFQLGKFTTAYRSGDEVGFLTWNPGNGRLFAQSELPPRGVRRSLAAYLAGESDDAPIDLSGGSALRQLTHRTSLREQILSGGPIVWPILLIAVVALVIVVAKIIFLNRMRGDTDRVMGRVNACAADGDWVACEQLVGDDRRRSWPVARVIRAGLESRHEDRETLESVLQESILHELPHVQRGIAMLAVLGAVAPLLGLLGTVTGMIETFRVITLFGTGDPKLMSGGISEALITTELGLAVAIPIMLLHTWLSRRSDQLIGEMEAKAVQLTNIIHKRKLQRDSGA